jgi:hypothetical protein
MLALSTAQLRCLQHSVLILLFVNLQREQFDGLQHGDVFCVVSTILLTLHVVSIAYSVGQVR